MNISDILRDIRNGLLLGSLLVNLLFGYIIHSFNIDTETQRVIEQTKDKETCETVIVLPAERGFKR